MLLQTTNTNSSHMRNRRVAISCWPLSLLKWWKTLGDVAIHSLEFFKCRTYHFEACQLVLETNIRSSCGILRCRKHRIILRKFWRGMQAHFAWSAYQGTVHIAVTRQLGMHVSATQENIALGEGSKVKKQNATWVSADGTNCPLNAG